MKTSYIPQNTTCCINLCRYDNQYKANHLPVVQSTMIMPLQRQRISLKNIKPSNQSTKCTSKPFPTKLEQEMTRTGTYRQTIDPSKSTKDWQTSSIKNKNNASDKLMIKRKETKSTDLISGGYVPLKYESVSARIHPENNKIDKLNLGLNFKYISEQTHSITKSHTERLFIPHVYEAKNTTTRNQSVTPSQQSKFLPISMYPSRQQSFFDVPFTQSIPRGNLSNNAKRDFQKEYETVNSVFSDSVINQRVQESTVMIDFFHPSRGKVFEIIEEKQISAERKIRMN